MFHTVVIEVLYGSLLIFVQLARIAQLVIWALSGHKAEEYKVVENVSKTYHK